ncbi:MAG: helix-turn-helix domain-containing protein [Coriobacteriia bacterium]
MSDTGTLTLDTAPDVLTVADVAALLGVAESTVRGAIARRELHAVNLGRRIIVPKAALVRFLVPPDTDGRVIGAPSPDEPG